MKYFYFFVMQCAVNYIRSNGIFFFNLRNNKMEKVKCMNPNKLILNSKVFCTAAILGMAAITTACSSGYKNHDISGAIPNTPSALEIISQESQKALNAQSSLVAYRDQYSNTLDYRRKSFTEDKVKVDYIGKPEPLLSSLAIRYGYRFLQYGAQRDLPTVNYTEYWGTPENIIVNLGAQLDGQAELSVDKQERVITLVYP